jgi:hypothetical protein
VNRIDEILAAIDSGLQTAGDTAYGNDRPGICWRCRWQSTTDLCAACRIELVAEEPLEKSPTNSRFITVRVHVDMTAINAAFNQLGAAFALLPDEMRRQIVQDHITIDNQHNIRSITQ